MSFLVLKGIQKRFPGGTVAVEDFNLAAEKGEFVSFLGPSGCGKTTTLRMIAGFETPTAGTITVGGNDITYRPANRRNVGMVFQSYALFPNMSVADNIGFGLRVRKRPKDQIRKRVQELLELINLPDKGGRYPYQLSGGQQQRVALARALAIEPEVLLLDEPLSALDAKIRVALRREIRSIQRQLGITTVYVTHDQEEAMSLSDRVVVMSEGRVEQIGPPPEIYNFPATPFVASFVGTLNLLPASVAADGATVTASPIAGGARAGSLNWSNESEPASPTLIRVRTIEPRKLTSSTAPCRRFGPPPSPSSTASGRSATVTLVPGRTAFDPVISWPATVTRAASTAVAGSRLSVPTNDATNGVAGKL